MQQTMIQSTIGGSGDEDEDLKYHIATASFYPNSDVILNDANEHYQRRQ